MKQELKRIIGQIEEVINTTRPVQGIYVAVPYTTEDYMQKQYYLYMASVYHQYLIDKEIGIPIIPILQCHLISQYVGTGTDWEFWREFNLALLHECDVLHVLTLEGWNDSVGVRAEMDAAMAMDIPIKGIKYRKNYEDFVEVVIA